MGKTKLKIDADFDFILIGIVTPIQDYRMAWSINNQLHKSLKKENDLMISDDKNRRVMSFSRFHYFESITRSGFNLVKNKHELDCLLPETKELDYLLLVSGDYYKSRSKEIIKKIKSIEEVLAVVILQPSQLKSKNNLIFDENQTVQ